MTRHIIRISLVMLLGVVTSVAVAWGCAWQGQRHWPDLGKHIRQPDWPNQGGFAVEVDERVWWVGKTGGHYHFFQLRDSVQEWEYTPLGYPRLPKQIPSWVPGPPEQGERYYLAAGFPFLCVESLTLTGEQENTRRVAWTKSRDLRLPYHPIWPGLLANTAIYGGVWWAMLFGPGMLIRWRRRRAGRCAKCGYDLRGSAPGSACPECGAER